MVEMPPTSPEIGDDGLKLVMDGARDVLLNKKGTEGSRRLAQLILEANDVALVPSDRLWELLVDEWNQGNDPDAVGLIVDVLKLKGWNPGLLAATIGQINSLSETQDNIDIKDVMDIIYGGKNVS